MYNSFNTVISKRNYSCQCSIRTMSSDVMVAVVDEHNAVNSGSVEMDVLTVYSGTSSSHAE